ncbi:MAG: hypothetical protein CMG64_04545 [Candidatus Marinimicrobia bacterium]|nr:hypothetical protein [Candidatus Neomarinimicrobiota bacterium]|tara:strand:+ start:7418 stop:8257 length:840 start_codon:yes stop_codon:yes gene_type:complete
MNNTPHIKILILNWNGIGVIPNCLESVNEISYENYSITVIDNGSVDESINYIKQNFENITIFENNFNYGFSKGYNNYFKHNEDNDTDYYLILNNDTVVDNNLLTQLVNASNYYGHNNIYSPIIKNKDQTIWYSGGKLIKSLGFTWHIGSGSIENHGLIKTKKTQYVSGCCMFIKRKIMTDLGGFNNLFNMYYEDVDFCLRAKKINSDCYVVENTYINHVVSYSSVNNAVLKKYILKLKSLIKFIFLNNNFFIFLISFLFNLILIPFTFSIYILKYIIKK